MPIHLNYSGTICPNCGTEFISFNDNCVCPNCGTRAPESFGFIEATIATMKDHKQMYGNYFPDAWFSASAADLVQGIIFELFDNLEIEKPQNAIDFIEKQLAAVEFEEGVQHLIAQTKDIALAVYEIYRQDPDFKNDNLKKRSLNPKLKDFTQN